MVTTTSLFDGGRVILEAQGGTFTGTYTYGVSLIRRNGEFFLYDGLGSARTFTNASGVVTAAAVYDGYGNTVATSGSTGSPYQFCATSGYRNDGDAGIMQVGARYYDPTTGSFLTRDTDLIQLAYVYCGDDPIDKVDPSGHDWLEPLMKVFEYVKKTLEIGTTIEINIININCHAQMVKMYQDWTARGGQDPNGSVIRLLYPTQEELGDVDTLTRESIKEIYPKMPTPPFVRE